jgi:protein O-GlcNAc transferase
MQPQSLRIGLVSGDLRDHPVGHFLEGLLRQIDRSRLEITAYDTQDKSDALTERMRPCCSTWTSLYGKSDEAAARQIRDDGIHVLIDLSGHTAHNRLAVFARKPAPVQVSWLGYFATTGVAEIDSLLADDVGVPRTHQDQFTEQIWYLPESRLCFTPPREAPAVSLLPAQTNGYITFGCFQNLAKIGDAVLTAWSRVLATLPHAVLRIQNKPLGDAPTRQMFMDRLRLHGIDPSRVALLAHVPRKEYLEAHAEVDFLLDTFPYPGGTTTCEALWMGVPTLTLAGGTLLARQGASLLTAAGLEDWVAASQDEYLAKAVAFAGDAARLAALRRDLRQQVGQSPVFDAPRFARHFEDALWGMWRNWVERSR